MTATLSIGLPSSIGPDAARALAPVAERAGFASFWLNDGRGGDSLPGLAAAAEATTHVGLGSGVIPLSKAPAARVLELLAQRPLPEERLVLGLGSGSPEDAVRRVALALDELRPRTRATLVVGALGPRMRRLAATRADGVLLNWLTPSALVEAMTDLRRDAGERPVRGILYVRTILDADAREALESEAASYGRVPAYRANFDRLGIEPLDATIDASEGTGTLEQRLAAYREAADEIVLRAVTREGSTDAYADFIERAAAVLR